MGYCSSFTLNVYLISTKYKNIKNHVENTLKLHFENVHMTFIVLGINNKGNGFYLKKNYAVQNVEQI